MFNIVQTISFVGSIQVVQYFGVLYITSPLALSWELCFLATVFPCSSKRPGDTAKITAALHGDSSAMMTFVYSVLLMMRWRGGLTYTSHGTTAPQA